LKDLRTDLEYSVRYINHHDVSTQNGWEPLAYNISNTVESITSYSIT